MLSAPSARRRPHWKAVGDRPAYCRSCGWWRWRGECARAAVVTLGLAAIVLLWTMDGLVEAASGEPGNCCTRTPHRRCLSGIFGPALKRHDLCIRSHTRWRRARTRRRARLLVRRGAGRPVICSPRARGWLMYESCRVSGWRAWHRSAVAVVLGIALARGGGLGWSRIFAAARAQRRAVPTRRDTASTRTHRCGAPPARWQWTSVQRFGDALPARYAYAPRRFSSQGDRVAAHQIVEIPPRPARRAAALVAARSSPGARGLGPPAARERARVQSWRWACGIPLTRPRVLFDFGGE